MGLMAWLRSLVTPKDDHPAPVTTTTISISTTTVDRDPETHAREVGEARERLQRIRDEIDIRARE